MNSFGDKLRKYRTAVGMTQEQLGFALGVTKSSVSAWENNRETPSFRLLASLGLELNQSLDVLVGDATADVSPVELKSSLRAATKDEEALLVRYRKLTVAKREALLELIKP